MAVTVIGVNGGELPDGSAEVLSEARVVVGSARHLEAYAPDGARTVETHGDGLDGALTVLSTLAGTETGVVLVSGDPGFFGAVSVLRERGIRCAVRPATSSVQRLMARVGRSWDDVTVVNASEQDLSQVINVCRARPAVVVLTAPGAGPAQIASGLAGWRRTMIVGEDLDGPHEKISTLEPAEAAKTRWPEPNVVLVVNEIESVPTATWIAGGAPVPPESGWALPAEEFSYREGTFLPSEVRAVALSKLAPRPGVLVWDVSSGAGSMAVECARLGAATVAVEPDEAQAMRLVTNAASHAVDVRIEESAPPKVLHELPKPDAVFVGDPSGEVVTACAHAGASRIVVAFTALDRLAPVRDVLRKAGYVVDGVQISASRLADGPDGSTRLEAAAPVVLISGVSPA